MSNESSVHPSEPSPALPAATPPPEGDSETVHKVYVEALTEGEQLHSVFKATRKSKVTARSGKQFLQATLVDRTGEIEARIFDDVEGLEKRFEAGDYVLVRGEVIAFHGKRQIKIVQAERLDPGPIDAKEFEFTAPEPAPTPETSASQAASAPGQGRSESGGMAALREILEKVQDPFVKALLLAFLDDPGVAKALPVAPAAKGIHHAYRGGLLDHILSVIRLALRISEHYPMLDRDLLIAGAFLHDIGKVSELSFEKGYDYTDEGRLVGHLVMTAQDIRTKAAAIPGFPKELEHHITHLVIAHHGQLEYGSPKLPVTLEAYVVHMIDSLDSRLASWLELMRKDPNDRWTDVARHYERHLWKGPSPTIRKSSPVEGRGEGRSGGKRRNRDRNREKSPARPARPDKAEHRESRTEPRTSGAALPKELTFKPFSLLSAPEQSPPPEQSPETTKQSES